MSFFFSFVHCKIGSFFSTRIILVGTITIQILAVNFNAFNFDRVFMFSEIPITGRTSYPIKANNNAKTKNQSFSRVLTSLISQYWGRTSRRTSVRACTTR